jgi:hypothetical protein
VIYSTQFNLVSGTKPQDGLSVETDSITDTRKANSIIYDSIVI